MKGTRASKWPCTLRMGLPIRACPRIPSLSCKLPPHQHLPTLLTKLILSSSPSQNFGFTYPYLTGLDDGKGGEGQPPPTPNPPPKLSKELNEILMYVQSIYQRQLYMEQDIGEQRHNQLSLEKKIMNKLHEIKLAVQSVESSFNTNMNPPTNPDEDFIPEPKPQVPFQQVEESSTVKDLTAGPTVPWIGAEPKWGFAQLKQYVPDQLELQEETEGVSPTALRPRPGKPDYNPPPPKPDREPRPRPKPRPQN
jgi:hypothetical protein